MIRNIAPINRLIRPRGIIHTAWALLLEALIPSGIFFPFCPVISVPGIKIILHRNSTLMIFLFAAQTQSATGINQFTKQSLPLSLRSISMRSDHLLYARRMVEDGTFSLYGTGRPFVHHPMKMHRLSGSNTIFPATISCFGSHVLNSPESLGKGL
ncbi:MAG: hypothetical protein IJ968_04860 [Clostridia bacterium]|nr:hypothetical protein [Clostridia bacterium]